MKSKSGYVDKNGPLITIIKVIVMLCITTWFPVLSDYMLTALVEINIFYYYWSLKIEQMISLTIITSPVVHGRNNKTNYHLTRILVT